MKDHLVTLPRKELEALELEAKSKKDTRLRFDVIFTYGGMRDYWDGSWKVEASVINNLGGISLKELDEVQQIMNGAMTEISLKYKNKISKDALEINDYKEIKQTWWFKLFASKKYK